MLFIKDAKNQTEKCQFCGLHKKSNVKTKVYLSMYAVCDEEKELIHLCDKCCLKLAERLIIAPHEISIGAEARATLAFRIMEDGTPLSEQTKNILESAVNTHHICQLLEKEDNR